MCDVQKLLEYKVSELGDLLEGMFQSPMDYSSDGYYDFFFPSGGFITHVLIDKGEEHPLELKIHLCIHVEESTGLVSRRVSYVEANDDHSVVGEFDVRGTCKTFSDYGDLAKATSGMIHRLNAFLEDFQLKTGIVFDLKPASAYTRGEMYSSVNAIFFKRVSGFCD